MVKKLRSSYMPLSHRILAHRLRQWRRVHGIPLKRFAYDLGFSITTVNAWERGKRFPAGRHLDLFSAYTGIPMCAFLYTGRDKCPHAELIPPVVRKSR
jgi:transcriptional regulator with XRE-family HTH domain